MDLSVYAAWLRGPDISQYIPKIFKKYPKIDYRAFASSRHHYAADNRTARDIHFGPFWVVKIQGGQCPPGPPDKNIPAHGTRHTYPKMAKTFPLWGFPWFPEWLGKKFLIFKVFPDFQSGWEPCHIQHLIWMKTKSLSNRYRKILLHYTGHSM